MEIQAAIVREPRGQFSLEQVELSEPNDDDDDGSIDKNCMIGRDANHTQIVAGACAVEERRRNHS